jgi:crotonobetainyl-CoA:carnitine CoA-transferase CaiB-like acyl-CoA transferase
VRVLDLTGVVAGPVCTRYLAALGAEVLRLDPPNRPDLNMPRGRVADSLLGKRSALLDLTANGGTATLHRLLDAADVVVCGYRPGALDRFGLSADALAERHPGVVAVYLAAWGHTGPWRARRGFDSVVLAPSGIAVAASIDGVEPGVLPCPLLDHGTGYLAAAAALHGLGRQSEEGGTHVATVSLARTAWWLTSVSAAEDAPPVAVHPSAPNRWMTTINSIEGPVTAVSPPGQLGEKPLRWLAPPAGYCDDTPTWLLP